MTRRLLLLSVGILLASNLHVSPVRASIRIRTVPMLPGAPFRVDGVVVHADARGRLLLPDSVRHVRILTVHRPGRTAYFRRWSDGVFSRARTLPPHSMVSVGYQVYADASPRFVDADPARGEPSVDPGSVLLMSSVGTYARLRAGETTSLLARRSLRKPKSLRVAAVTWRVLRVDSHGANLVYRGQQSFDPLLEPHAIVKLAFFDVRVEADTALLGTSFNGQVAIILPDKSIMHRRISHEGPLLLRLPRGSYEVRIDAPGVGVNQPFVVAEDTLVSVRYLSVLDIGALAGLLFVLAGGLLLMGRPGLIVRSRATVRPTTKPDTNG